MISGDILAGESCPYTEDCAHLNQDCPTPSNLKVRKHCCWAARSWHMLDSGNDSVPLRNLVQRVRRIIPIQGGT